MKILSIIPCHDERYFLPLQIRHLAYHGVDVVVADNESSDGTWEWLQSANVKAISFSTGDAFDLPAIQSVRQTLMMQHKPDWVVYGDADEFFVSESRLSDLIEQADAEGFNQISVKSFEMYDTGENCPVYDGLVQNYFGNYRYSKSGLVRIHKFSEWVRYDGDDIWIPQRRIKNIDVVNVNYGPSRPPEQKDARLLRRQKAWSQGMDEKLGAHYRYHKTQSWVFDRHLCLDARKQEWWSRMECLLNEIGVSSFNPHPA